MDGALFMIYKEALPFIEEFLATVNETLNELREGMALSGIQVKWLSFCLMGILMTNRICWSKFFRASLGQYKISSLSWMLRHSKIFWDKLLMASILVILKKYDLRSGVLILDDSDKQRSKKTKRIHKAHKIFDKATSGYFNGQSIVFLLLATEKITIPVGFKFYEPDPDVKEWEKEDSQLKEQGIKKGNRPPRPDFNPKYPSKLMLASALVSEFKEQFPFFKVEAILADALYGSANFIDEVSKVYPKTQIISQLRSNQLVKHFRNMISLKEYFRRNPGVSHLISVRGKEPVRVTMHGARILVDAHGVKRFVIALKYDGEEEYRYIFATDLAWRMKDIVQAYSLRWLVEVFFQDWKGHEGWGELKLLDVEGSERAVILSLLFDYSLLFHPSQLRVEGDKLPAYTVGSLLRKCRVDAFLQYLKNILNSDNPMLVVEKIEESIGEIHELVPSSKHMNGRCFGNMEPAEKLLHRREYAMAS